MIKNVCIFPFCEKKHFRSYLEICEISAYFLHHCCSKRNFCRTFIVFFSLCLSSTVIMIQYYACPVEAGAYCPAKLCDTLSVCHLPLHFCPVISHFSSSLAFSCISSQFSPHFPAAFQNALPLPSFLWAFHHMHAHMPFHPVIHPVSVCVWGCYRWVNRNDGWSEWSL